MKPYKFYKLEEHPFPHLGDLFTQYFLKNRTRKSSLSRLLGVKAPVITYYKKQPTQQCATLWKLCYALNHNFFADLAAQLPADFTTYAPDPTLALQEELEQLREENKLLRTQVETLKEVMRKG